MELKFLTHNEFGGGGGGVMFEESISLFNN